MNINITYGKNDPRNLSLYGATKAEAIRLVREHGNGDATVSVTKGGRRSELVFARHNGITAIDNLK
jgi:hypothetical protein